MKNIKSGTTTKIEIDIISTDDNRAAREDVRTVWSSLMCSTLEATLLSPTSRQCNNNQG